MAHHDVIDAIAFGVANDLLGRMANDNLEVRRDRLVRDLPTRGADHLLIVTAGVLNDRSRLHFITKFGRSPVD
jgi:hypothetical protein